MSGRQIKISGRMDRLEEIVRKAGIELHKEEKPAIPPAKSSQNTELEIVETPAQISDEEIFLKEMEGVERLLWNRKSPKTPERLLPTDDNHGMEQYKLMQKAMESSTPIPITDHPEYIEGWIGVTGKRYLPNLRNGLYSIQGQIDLHGMTREEAQTAVESYIIRMSRFRSCCIKIIHGRGINSPMDRTTLKDSLPKLFATRKMSRYVIAYTSSSASDGGVGSMYVLLRNKR